MDELQDKYIQKYAVVSNRVSLKACEAAKAHIDQQVKDNIVPYYLSEEEIEKEYEYSLNYMSELANRKMQKETQLYEIENDKILTKVRQYTSSEEKEKIEAMILEIENTLNNRIAEAEEKDKANVERIKEGYATYLSSVDNKVAEMNQKALAKREHDEQEKAREEKLHKEIRETRIKFTLFALVLAVIVIVVIRVISGTTNYNNATKLMDSGNYTEAIKKFRAAKGYKDSDEIIEKYELNQWNRASVGDVVTLGVGPDKNLLEWIVLEKNENDVFLVTKQVLDIVNYNEEYESITWENCTVRTYLNNEFIKNTFSSEERARIKQVKLQNKDNEEYGTSGGNDTTDKVFCLSIDEVNIYFVNDEDRVAIPTEYVKEKVRPYLMEVFLDESSGGALWWLRSPGNDDESVAYVDGSGDVNVYGASMYYDDRVGIRPALWINLEP